MRTISLLVLSLVIFDGGPAAAQALRQVPRIGFLMPGGTTDKEAKRDLEAFVQGLKEVGYVIGEDIIVEYHAANRKINELPRLAAELVRSDVALIVAVGTTAITVVLQATKTMPIVMISGGNPVNRGFVKSLAEPGGNVTGLSSATVGETGKRLELLKDVFPKISRVMILNADRRTERVENSIKAGREQGMVVEAVHAHSAEELTQALAKIASQRPDALITVRNAFTIRYAEEIVNFTVKHRLRSIFASREFIEKGGLMSFGVDYTASWRRSADYVDKILKGASPAVIPIEPPQFEFVVNLRTANKMQWKIPPQILLEANEVIR